MAEPLLRPTSGAAAQFAALLRAAAFRRTVGRLIGDTVSRVPRGFDKDHPAAEWLKHTQWMGAREEAAAFATRPDFYEELLATWLDGMKF